MNRVKVYKRVSKTRKAVAECPFRTTGGAPMFVGSEACKKCEDFMWRTGDVVACNYEEVKPW